MSESKLSQFDSSKSFKFELSHFFCSLFIPNSDTFGQLFETVFRKNSKNSQVSPVFINKTTFHMSNNFVFSSMS